MLMYFYKTQYSYMKMILGIENHNSNIIYGHAPQYYKLLYIYIYIYFSSPHSKL